MYLLLVKVTGFYSWKINNPRLENCETLQFRHHVLIFSHPLHFRGPPAKELSSNCWRGRADFPSAVSSLLEGV